ncbi:MAG TPA: hypothetical protein VKG44_01380 [Candidatus Baltobacteraceae bacterium]|nr:hypothetical protein [Candidatus Baltobacteraceae bacterium]
MNEIHQRMFVNCPASEAAPHLDSFFCERRHGAPEESTPVTLALRAPVQLPGLGTEIVLQRDVVVTVAPATPQSAGEMHVRFEPAGGGTFPRFDGSLSLAEGDRERFCLVLEGHYGGASTGVLRPNDLSLGHRIAVATARSLLCEIRDAVERSYRRSGLTREVTQ